MLSRSQSAFVMVRALRIIFNVFLTENGALPIRVVRDDGERPEVEFIQLLDACQLLAAGDLPGCIKQLLPNRFPAMKSPLRAASSCRTSPWYSHTLTRRTANVAKLALRDALIAAIGI